MPTTLSKHTLNGRDRFCLIPVRAAAPDELNFEAIVDIRSLSGRDKVDYVLGRFWKQYPRAN